MVFRPSLSYLRWNLVILWPWTLISICPGSIILVLQVIWLMVSFSSFIGTLLIYIESKGFSFIRYHKYFNLFLFFPNFPWNYILMELVVMVDGVRLSSEWTSNLILVDYDLICYLESLPARFWSTVWNICQVGTPKILKFIDGWVHPVADELHSLVSSLTIQFIWMS